MGIFLGPTSALPPFATTPSIHHRLDLQAVDVARAAGWVIGRPPSCTSCSVVQDEATGVLGGLSLSLCSTCLQLPCHFGHHPVIHSLLTDYSLL